MNALSASGLADLAGATRGRGRAAGRAWASWWPVTAPARSCATDVQKVRLAGGVRAGRAAHGGDRGGDPGGPAVVRLPGGLPVPAVGGALGADLPAGQPGDRGAPGACSAAPWSRWGSPGWAPDEPIREDELEVVPLLQLGLSSGILDLAWSARLGRGYAEGLRLLASGRERASTRRGSSVPLLASGADQRTAMEQASQLTRRLHMPLVDRALHGLPTAGSRSWRGPSTWSSTSRTSSEETGVLGRPGRVPAMCFLDLVGYTRLTEERGDAAAAALAATLAGGYRTGGGGLVDSSARLLLPAPTPTPGSRPTPGGDQPNTSRIPPATTGTPGSAQLRLGLGVARRAQLVAVIHGLHAEWLLGLLHGDAPR